MAFMAEDRRPSLTSLYEQIYKDEDESDNLWASLLREVAENKHHSLPSKQLLVLGLSSLLSLASHCFNTQLSRRQRIGEDNFARKAARK